MSYPIRKRCVVVWSVGAVANRSVFTGIILQDDAAFGCSYLRAQRCAFDDVITMVNHPSLCHRGTLYMRKAAKQLILSVN